ncbi:MAG: hypothetical protein U9P12_05840, partial [Verrucomicrobiota bacterium]|nr:hypothetical protein [Verrucomicrobiota bacterium]
DSEIRVQANGSNFVFRANYLDSPATVPVDTGTHLFVLKFEFGDTDTMTFWMDPADLDNETNSTPTTAIDAIFPSSVEFSFLTLDRGVGGTSGNGVLFDEIRFASEWGDSLFTSITAVPPLPGTPTNLAWSFNGVGFSFVWPIDYTGWVLQCQTNALGSNGWMDIPGSAATNGWQTSILPDVDSAFYRLRFP